MTTAIQRSVAAISLVQAFGREAEEYARFHNTARNSASAYVRLHGYELLYSLMVGVIFAIGGALIFGYGGLLVYNDQFVNHVGEGGMTLGKLTVFLAYLAQLYAPLQNLIGAGASIRAAPSAPSVSLRFSTSILSLQTLRTQFTCPGRPARLRSITSALNT